MFRITLAGVRGHLLRFILTTMSVVLGVAFVAGTQVLTASLQGTFDKIFSGATAGTDVLVRGARVNESAVGGGGELRRPLNSEQAQTLAKIPGVAAAYPDLQGFVAVVGKDGTAVRNGGAPSFGFDFRPNDPALPLIAGRAPQSIKEIALERSSLEKSGWSLGDVTKIVVSGKVLPVTIVGEVSFSGAAGQTIVVLDPGTARTYFAPDGKVQQIVLQAQPGVSQDTLRSRVAASLSAGQEAITGKAYAAEQRTDFANGLGFLNTFLLVFALVSLLVGGFIIANTFSMLVAQRTRELALLRAVGSSRAQVTGIVLGEAAVIGLVGGVLGLLAGVLLARGLQVFVGVIGIKITGGLPVTPATVFTALSVGLFVTLGSAVAPAWRAGRIAPVAALRDDIALPERSLRRRGVLGLSLLLLGAALMAFAVLHQKENAAAQTLGVGALAAFLGMVAAAPLLSRPVIRALGWFGARFFGSVGRIARDNTLRNPRRTATTAVSLMIGLTLVSAFAVLAASSKASVNSLVDDQVRADYVLSAASQPFSRNLVIAAAKVPGVSAAVGQSPVPVKIKNQTELAAAVTGSGLAQTIDLVVLSGDLATIDRGSIAVSDTFAKKQGLRVGQDISADVGVLPAEKLTVGAIYAESAVIDSPILVPESLYDRAIPAAQQLSFSAFIRVAPGADSAAVRTELVKLVKPQLTISVLDREEFKKATAAQIDQILAIIYALLALSIIIAALGILNTLALSVFERTREIGLLRAIGLTRRQLRRTIAQEAMLTALFGAVLGTALGLVLGVLLRQVLADQGLTALAIPWGQVILTFVLAGVVGLLAAVWPAWRAAKLDVIRAIGSA